MTQKSVLYLGIFLFVAGITTGGVLWYAQKVQREEQRAQKQMEEEQKQVQEELEKKQEEQQNQKFVTDVDMNVNHWQTKETEFFTIKFPKEWYWMESDQQKTGYYSQVITNNPNFDIEKYADIGVFTRDSYSLNFKNDSEIIISTDGSGDITSNTGTPFDYMKSEIKRRKELYPSTECKYTSKVGDIPLTVYCSFMDYANNQLMQTYYISYKNHTFGYTARTNKENNNTNMKDLLEEITRNVVWKKSL